MNISYWPKSRILSIDIGQENRAKIFYTYSLATFDTYTDLDIGRAIYKYFF